MCQLDVCACSTVQSGREGPRIHLVVDRRARPWVGDLRERRGADRPAEPGRRGAADVPDSQPWPSYATGPVHAPATVTHTGQPLALAGDLARET